MPPRKSDASKVVTDVESTSTPAKESSTTEKSAKEKDKEKEKDGINIEDLNLPKSIVTRLAKGVLPPNTQIQGNAMLAMSKSATVFVNYLATHANEYAQGSNRKTIAPADVLRALEDLEFDFRDRLDAELARFNEVQTVKRNTYRKKVAADKSAKPGDDAGDDANGVFGAAHASSADADGERAAKKARVDAGEGQGVSVGGGEGDETLGDVGDEEDEGAEDDFVEEEEEEEDGANEGGEEGDGEGEGEGEETEGEAEEREEREVEVQDEALDNGEDSD